MWGAKYTVIPIVIGGLGAVTPHCVEYLRVIPGEPDIHMCQKITLLGSEDSEEHAGQEALIEAKTNQRQR